MALYVLKATNRFKRALWALLGGGFKDAGKEGSREMRRAIQATFWSVLMGITLLVCIPCSTLIGVASVLVFAVSACCKLVHSVLILLMEGSTYLPNKILERLKNLGGDPS